MKYYKLYSIIKSMKVCGIVCEYNPFHYGHKYHIQKSKEVCNPDVIVCVMSGNFVQRGECAIIDKWERSKTAIMHGADIVLELPFAYATQSATQFAKGSIDVLKLAKIDCLVFGSESNDLDKLLQLSKNTTTLSLEEGIAPVKAYENMYGTLLANDILGINYLKQIENTNIVPYCIQRTNNYHDTKVDTLYSSATAIRNALYKNEDVSKLTPMNNLDATFKMENYFPYIKMMLLTTPPSILKNYFLMDEGIENNFIKNIKIADSYDAFISLCVSKRYTKSKIQRTLLHMIHQTTKDTINTLPEMDTIRVLAYNENGKQYLKQLKKQDVKIASRFNQIPEPYRSMELKAAHVYAHPLEIEKQKECIQKEVQSPIFIK